MKANQAEHSVATLCRVLRVSASGYYAWVKRPPSLREQRDRELVGEIHRIHKMSRTSYGSPRIHREFRDDGIRIGRKRVERLMKRENLVGICRRKWVRTTERCRGARPAPDLVDRRFVADGPDKLWVADITYIPTGTTFLFLSVVMDVWSRKIVGWSMASHLRTELVLAALDMALELRKPSGVIHHSDQGTQYTSIDFGLRCKRAGVRPSMGSVGDAYDNAMCESFFATLEWELLQQTKFANHAEAEMAIFEFIEGWYNTRRRHSGLDYMSPVNYERKALEMVAVR